MVTSKLNWGRKVDFGTDLTSIPSSTPDSKSISQHRIIPLNFCERSLKVIFIFRYCHENKIQSITEIQSTEILKHEMKKKVKMKMK